MEMAQYILSILRTQIAVLFSWGAHDFTAVKNGLKFNVQGFVFSGIVKVLYDGGSDTFVVRLENADGSLHSEHTEVYLDCLVNVIDRAVEKDCSQSEYVAKIDAAYKQ